MSTYQAFPIGDHGPFLLNALKPCHNPRTLFIVHQLAIEMCESMLFKCVNVWSTRNSLKNYRANRKTFETEPDHLTPLLKSNDRQIGDTNFSISVSWWESIRQINYYVFFFLAEIFERPSESSIKGI